MNSQAAQGRSRRADHQRGRHHDRARREITPAGRGPSHSTRQKAQRPTKPIRHITAIQHAVVRRLRPVIRAEVRQALERSAAADALPLEAALRQLDTEFELHRLSHCPGDAAVSRPTTRRVVVVRTGSEVGVDESGCSPTRARPRCACRSSRIRPAAGTPATPAIAAKEGSRCGGSQLRTVEGVEMRTFGARQQQVPHHLWQGTCSCVLARA